MADIAETALAQFRHRQENAGLAVARGAVPRDQAEALLRPWASIALRAGARLPDLADAIEGFITIAGRPLTEAERREVIADQLCPLPACRARIAASLERAIADPASPEGRARDALTALAIHFLAIPYRNRPVAVSGAAERKAA